MAWTQRLLRAAQLLSYDAPHFDAACGGCLVLVLALPPVADDLLSPPTPWGALLQYPILFLWLVSMAVSALFVGLQAVLISLLLVSLCVTGTTDLTTGASNPPSPPHTHQKINARGQRSPNRRGVK